MIKIELKRIAHMASMSEETHCYTAELYVDGEHWGQVGNEGHGGPDFFRGVGGKSYADLKPLDERIAAECPLRDLTDIGLPGRTMPASLEILCGEAVNDFLMGRELKRTLSRNLAYFKTRPTAKGREPLWTISLKKNPSFTVEALVDHVRRKEPDAVVLNVLPQEEALALFRMAR